MPVLLATFGSLWLPTYIILQHSLDHYRVTYKCTCISLPNHTSSLRALSTVHLSSLCTLCNYRANAIFWELVYFYCSTDVDKGQYCNNIMMQYVYIKVLINVEC